jgi:hypothetical protein
VWLLALTPVIVGPVIIGLLLATVATPLVSWMQRHGVPLLAMLTNSLMPFAYERGGQLAGAATVVGSASRSPGRRAAAELVDPRRRSRPAPGEASRRWPELQPLSASS